VKVLRVVALLVAAVSIGATDDDWEYLGTHTVTAYCPCPKCCGRWADGRTADGTKLGPRSRVVAAPHTQPFDTVLYVPGYGAARVADRGKAIKGKRLDVFFWSHRKAVAWGVKELEVWRKRSAPEPE